MEQSIVHLVRSIKDSALAKFKVPHHCDETVFIDCIYKEADAPNFFLVFPPESVPEGIAPGQKCSVAIHSENEPLTLSATIEGIRDDRSLVLQAQAPIDPVSLREYFRVTLSTTIIASFEPGISNSKQKPWQCRGTTIDLSGTGVLAVFPRQFENLNNIFIELRLPDTEKVIQCVGRVVRMTRLRKQRCQIALHFDRISAKDRDAIITACLQEQRRQLRLRMESD